MSTYWKTILFAVVLGLSAAAVFAQNTNHQGLLKMTPEKRAEVMAKVLNNSGADCRKGVTRTFFRGLLPSGAAIWDATCKDAESYSIRFYADSTGSTAVADCRDVQKEAGKSCFKKLAK